MWESKSGEIGSGYGVAFLSDGDIVVADYGKGQLSFFSNKQQQQGLLSSDVTRLTIALSRLVHLNLGVWLSMSMYTSLRPFFKYI